MMITDYSKRAETGIKHLDSQLQYHEQHEAERLPQHGQNRSEPALARGLKDHVHVRILHSILMSVTWAPTGYDPTC